VAVSVRPHEIALARAPSRGTDGVGTSAWNELPGTLERASFLGDSGDYQVRLAGGDVVWRVAAPTSLRLHAGEAVVLRIDPAACVPLADEGEPA
jgi:hypothetical protein